MLRREEVLKATDFASADIEAFETKYEIGDEIRDD
jgi:hypothetical protein